MNSIAVKRGPGGAATGGGRIASTACLLLAGVVLSGCILGTERPDPALDIPDRYREAARNQGPPRPPSEAWWRGFRSAELTRLMELAPSGNFDIAVAVAQIAQADAQAGISRAPLFPSLTGTGSAERARSPATANAGPQTFSQFNLGLTASYMVDFWGKNRAAFYAAEENAIVSRYNRDVVTLSAISTVANTYFQILAAQDQLRVARNNVAAAERILNLIKLQFAGGTASQLDVSQQAALVGIQRATIPPLVVTERQNMAALAVLVGRAPERLQVRGGSMAQIAIPRVTPGLPSQLLYHRPDVRQAEEQLAASNFSVEVARASFFPQIQLTGQTGFQSGALSSLFAPGAWYYSMIAGLTQPIFDGYLLKSQLEQAKGVQLQNLQLYRKAVISAFADVDKALIALQQTTLQERLQADVVANSRRAFQVAETQLRAGTVNLITVLQTQQTLFTAETALAQVRLAKLLAAVSLFQALGGGWTIDDTTARRIAINAGHAPTAPPPPVTR
ncbi:MAG: efflux transporter outer membrane subunit [Rhizobiales bacterium]|nr:efflux transporter outer membrane subunit [Hyphomicrobiales bacterium]